MANDILGPANAANAVTVRPSDTRTFGPTDTWLKDCTSPEADDGTDITASFLNGIIASLRNVWRMNGAKANTDPVVAEANDDAALARAIQHLVQRGQVLYGVDTGAANALVVTLVPALVEYKAGLKIRVKVAETNSGGTATINVNGLGAVQIVRRDGSPLLDSDLIAGAVVDLVYDGAKFQVPTAVGRPQLVRNLTLYVNGATGNDANSGIAAAPVKTIQRAVDIAFGYQAGGFTVTIQIADGTYAGVATPSLGGPAIILRGNPANPAAVVIDGGLTHAVAVSGPNALWAEHLTVQTGVGSASSLCGFFADGGASVATNNTRSGYCHGAVFNTTFSNLSVGHHTFAGGGKWAFWALGGIINLLSGSTYTVVAAITYSLSFVRSESNGAVIAGSVLPAFVGGGNVTGTKFVAAINGTINTGGAGAGYFPGTSAGVTQSGGQYL